jgi:hypothetical protein
VTCRHCNPACDILARLYDFVMSVGLWYRGSLVTPLVSTGYFVAVRNGCKRLQALKPMFGSLLAIIAM